MDLNDLTAKQLARNALENDDFKVMRRLRTKGPSIMIRRTAWTFTFLLNRLRRLEQRVRELEGD